jgi:hypothetical protein
VIWKGRETERTEDQQETHSVSLPLAARPSRAGRTRPHISPTLSTAERAMALASKWAPAADIERVLQDRPRPAGQLRAPLGDAPGTARGENTKTKQLRLRAARALLQCLQRWQCGRWEQGWAQIWQTQKEGAV